MKLPFQLGLGGPLGNGKQLFPWIHLEDLRDIIIQLSQQWTHDFTIGESHPTKMETITPFPPGIPSQKEVAKAFAQALKRPGFMPTPGFIIQTIFGQMGKEALLGSPKVDSSMSYLYDYKYKDLESALSEITASF